jgi:ketosteroid isomerase-like protein
VKRTVLLLICSLPLFLISCTQQQAEFDSASARKAIEDANAKMSSYAAKGDSVDFANLYTDAIVLPPNSNIVQGHDAIESYWGSTLRLGKINVQLNIKDVFGSGNIAVETGNHDIYIKPEGTTPIMDHGKYMVIWEKQNDNSWKLKRDMWSSDLPAASN